MFITKISPKRLIFVINIISTHQISWHLTAFYRRVYWGARMFLKYLIAKRKRG